MDKKRYEEIKNIEENLKGIARLKYLTEEISDQERLDYFEYKRFIKSQIEWVGII